MEIKTNGQRNITLDFNAPKKFRLLKDGQEIPYLRRKIGFVFQDFRLLYDRTVEENIVFALRVVEASEREIKTQLKTVLQMVGLSGKEKFYPNKRLWKCNASCSWVL